MASPPIRTEPNSGKAARIPVIVANDVKGVIQRRHATDTAR